MFSFSLERMMEPKRPAFVLEVIGGDEHGTQLEIGTKVLTIGRASDRDLVLRDLGVSRRHVQVVATENGVQFDVCEGAATFTMGGRPFRSVEAKVGDRVLVGNTLLVVMSAAPASEPRPPRGPADVRTVLTGIGADARAMAAVHALIEALDAAPDQGALDGALAAWTSDQTPSCTVDVCRGPGASSRVEEREEAGATVIVVPAPADEPVSLAFRCSGTSERVSDSFRRMLVVAGRLFGSSLARLRRADVADGEVAALRARSFGTARDFLGTSPGALRLASLITRVASASACLLIEGETGVGKTFVARLIHEAGPRAREPLRVINCAAIPENLLESELFGHERGAFTGATSGRAGALESAGGGTLFLDEIGELSLASQAKLLRAVEEKKFERLGSNRTLDVRARILCATNRDLAAMATEGRFRSDLLFRISVVKLTIPPLRDRGDDLVLIANQLLLDAAATAHRRVEGFSEQALAIIRGYSWPGNVRELRNAIEHAIVLGEDRLIQATDLPAGILASPDDPPDRGSAALVVGAIDLEERRAITEALRATGGNRTRAAALLGFSRVTLYKKLGRM